MLLGVRVVSVLHSQGLNYSTPEVGAGLTLQSEPKVRFLESRFSVLFNSVTVES